ncbi:MAG: hypothetical protein WB392_13345 [Methanotrichaceae archaeon]
MANTTDFISWYMLQNFPRFGTEIINTAAASVLSGYDEAKAHILSLPNIEKDYTILAMASVLDVMNRYGLAPEDASYLLRRLNSIALSEE